MNLQTKLLFLVLLFPGFCLAKTYSTNFTAPYDLVWKATLISLANYPLDKNSQETGEIETVLLKGSQAWTPYHRSLSKKEEYKLYIQTIKQSNNSIKVSITKKAHLKGDFINATKEIESDGIEESVLLYRISREIVIDKIMDKTFN